MYRHSENCYFYAEMSKIIHTEYDVIVCGAGPAGLMAACTYGRLTGGAGRVLLLDKKEPWKEPIFCAEAVAKDRLKALWPVSQSFVRGNVSGVYFTSPKRFRAEFYDKDCGLLLNRSLFHHSIADGCVEAGVECHYDIMVQKLSREQGMWIVDVKSEGETQSVKAKVVIDATGPGCRLTRNIECLEGIESGDTDLEPAIFAVAEGIEHSKEHIELFFGSEFPDGYGWIFPRDGVEVNIGFVLGKNANVGVPLRQKLVDFIKSYYPTAKIKAVYGGMIACGQSNRPHAKCGLFKAGDAASCVNPISRSGIVESLISGKIVAEAVHQWMACSSDAERERVESSVLDSWMKALGRSHMQLSKAKAAFGKLPDSLLDRAAEKLSKIPREKTSLGRIFFTVLLACPSLLWKMRSFLR